MGLQSVSNNLSTSLLLSDDMLSKKVIDSAHCSWLQRHSAFLSLKRDLAAVSPEQLKIVIENVAQEPDGKEILDRLAQIIPLEKLQEAIQTNAVDSIKDMAREGLDYLEKIKTRTPTMSAHLSSFLDTACNVLESFLNAFGIAEFFKSAESKSDAKVKAQWMMMLLQFSVLLSTLSLPVFGPGIAGLVVASTMLTIWTLSLIYPHIRRMPSTLPFAENWTRQYQMCDLSAGSGRKETVDEIARTLIASKTVKTHPLLIGESGIGKTETAKAFVEAVEKGHYPELKGKQIFYINAAELIGKEDGTRILARINEIMGRHRDDIILIFDEIHIVCEKRSNSAFGDQLKTMLDEGPNKFPHFIGITTKEEYYRHIYSENPAFARRFKQIKIDSTSMVETLQVLRNTLLKQEPRILVTPDGLERLVEKTNEAFGLDTAQPASSLKVLSLCIKKTAETQRSPLEQKIEAVRNQIQFHYLKRSKQKSVVEGLERELAELETLLRREKEELEVFYQHRDRLAEIRKTVYQSAVKLKNGGSQTEMNRFLLLDQVVIPTLEAKIIEEADRLGVKTVIDEALIDEVIQEEQQNGENARQLIQKAAEKATLKLEN